MLINPLLPLFQGHIVHIIIIVQHWHFINLSNEPLVSLINNSVAGLGSPSLNLVLVLPVIKLSLHLFHVREFPHGLFYKLYTNFHLSITLVIA